MQQANWQAELRKTKIGPATLLEDIGLARNAPALANQAAISFPLRVTEGFKNRITNGDEHDPLLRQILPLAEEDRDHPDFSFDPLAEYAKQPVPGLLHKYHGRALLVVTGACAIHCRYCFRRHFPYAESNPASQQWQTALDYLARDQTVTEIILSGGDPLTVSDERLSGLVQSLADIPHIKRLRIHSRIPVVLPERIVDTLLDWLTGTRLRPVMVVHANHANELDNSVAMAMEKLKRAHVPLLNQSVLLRGVNDSVTALAMLSERLFDYGILPYYLHMLDPVKGAAHFAVDETQARSIMQGLRELLPGYLVPKLVREIPDTPSKILL
ncbi:MAG: EF-P beta-lysylation protein EpmB [Gammaproteobacteria bacterium RIFCSPLOWO2_02_FULL_47_50]|jgi:EF-P beta-lysylation protein EpmB|nr:MAG: EF-P beta-lysylation protein EpmB [Gammaproteobacteria bacterium RIFCSPLOWO2_01_FULL_47_190]OGT77021.1 MAG: EF-P beta-lysylation protein EpmB [Gammaproteobacteria bacterium RIFCSPLOWO2_12_47_11]OGT78242.1 MAG: EF-P beta-lysylation protein EpmB [Gammaproteobacteria bacterium RIFCSPLOWO2_02_FULL_47_50]OGT83294.1 MAG: EF-P beta-lysylation protein EpmB [Gammaproteobacteria bacterium RIFCSPLOWO2_12_FULL_47_76]